MSRLVKNTWVASNLPTHSGLGSTSGSGGFNYLSLIQTILMGYGAYCLMTKTFSFIKKMIVGAKKLPVHED